MALREDTRTIVPGASMAMEELSSGKAHSEDALYALVKRAFETFIHLRVRACASKQAVDVLGG